MGSVSYFPLMPRVAAPDEPDPASPGAAPKLPATGGRRGEYGVGDVARELRLSHFTPRHIIDQLRALAEHSGMPLPRTPRIEKGVPIEGPRQIYIHSRWDAGEFDYWLDGRGPAAPTPALADAVRAEMRRRAAAIGGRAPAALGLVAAR